MLDPVVVAVVVDTAAAVATRRPETGSAPAAEVDDRLANSPVPVLSEQPRRRYAVDDISHEPDTPKTTTTIIQIALVYW